MIACIIILLVGAAALLYAAKRSLKVLIVLAVLAAQFVWFAWPRVSLHGAVVEEPYRNAERMEALRAWLLHPSATTEAANKRENEMLYTHLARRGLVELAALALLDGVGLFYFWNYGKRTLAQLGAAPNGGPAMRLGDSGAGGGPPSVS